MHGKLILAFAALAALSACGASLQGGSAAREPAAGEPIGGLPYRIRDQLNVEVYRLTEKGYVLVGSQTELLADPSQLYVLNFEGRPLADATLKVDQRPDGSLSIVNLGSTGKGAELATNVASGMDAIQAASKANAEAQKAIDAAALATSDKAKTEAGALTQAQLNAVRTRDEAYRLQLKLEEDRASLKPSEVLAAESAIRIAKMQANTAAVALGQSLPFPEIQ